MSCHITSCHITSRHLAQLSLHSFVLNNTTTPSSTHSILLHLSQSTPHTHCYTAAISFENQRNSGPVNSSKAGKDSAITQGLQLCHPWLLSIFLSCPHEQTVKAFCGCVSMQFDWGRDHSLHLIILAKLLSPFHSHSPTFPSLTLYHVSPDSS
jgi:hypothetical protein